jgi:hypothetical protein
MRSIPLSRGLVALAAALAAALVGCGGDDDGGGGGGTTSAETFVSQVCTSVSEFDSVVEEGQAELEQVTDPEKGRDLLVGLLGDAAAAAERTRTDIEAVGAPDVDGGDEAADAISTALSELQATLQDAQTEAEGIATGSAVGFITDAQEISRRLQQSGQEIQESLEAVGENEELDAAADEVEACDEL